MNYKVMKRPMFKLGGKANSQGTGVTSGLDERVDLKEAGFLGTGMSQSDFGALTPQGLMDLQAGMLTKSSGGMDNMRDIIRLQALSNLAGNVLPNIESGGLRAVTDFLRDPQTTQTAIKGLTGLKRVDLAQDKMNRENLSNLIKNQMEFKLGERKFEQSDTQFNKLYDIKKEQLDINREKASVLTATQVRVNSGNEAREILRQAGVTSPNELTDPLLKDKYEELKNIADGTMTSDQKRKLATTIATGIIEKQAAEQGLNPIKLLEKDLETAIQAVMAGLSGGNAMGGTPNRVNRAMGTPMVGEQPMNQGMGMTEQQDVAMETQGQGQNAYAMLRARLPQEVSDEVVKLIAYNKEAFADFASIKNQEDVSSFNDKYGVQLVIDVATV
jgi:hypothetical protein